MKPRILALYLPQFHPIPENDKWWGPGFTEWTNVAKAKPLFKGHTQPRIPADLGFYDLRLPEIREQQAQLAREAGIEGFCYYHYWFGDGRQLLERPFNEVLASGKPDFPFCLCWANHTWSTATWQRKTDKNSTILMEQQYLGQEDDIKHFMSVLPAFKDKRYIHIDGRPVFVLWEPRDHPHVKQWIKVWRDLATENGLPGLYLIGMTHSTLAFKQYEDGRRVRTLPNLKSSKEVFQNILDMGFDAVNSYGKRRGEMLRDGKYINLAKTALRRIGIPIGRRFDYSKTVKNFFAPEDCWENVYPTIFPQWDRTPRKAAWDGIYTGACPEKFEQHILHAMDVIKNKAPEHQVLFMKSWNEWGEGNYVEPDEEYGHGWLQAIRNAVDKNTEK